MLTGKGLVEYAEFKLGTPYFFGAKMQILTESIMKSMHKAYPSTVTNSYMKKARDKGQVGIENTDCSGLPGAYRKKQLGSAQLYSSAYTRLPISRLNEFAPGVVLYRKGHVGVYDGKGHVIEAKGINYGTVRSVASVKNWTHGLTFKDIDYSYETNLAPVATWKGKNPYEMPAIKIKKGQKGTGVKWLQWELKEAGYDLDIDGSFGKITLAALKDFQKSCKIKVDGVCGEITKAKLKEC